MRILLLTHAGGSPRHGPNMRWYYLGQALKKYGVEVEIVSSSYFHKYIELPDVSSALQSEEVDGLQYHWLKTRPYTGRGAGQVVNQMDFVAKIYRHSEEFLKRRPDIIIASSPHPFVIFPARRLANKARVPLIYEVRDLWPELLCQLGELSRRHPYIVMNSLAEKYAVRHADLIISVKPGDADYFAEKYATERSNCVYIPNGFLPGGSVNEPPAELRELRSKYKYLVGYVGAVSRYYGLDELVNLAAAFRQRDDVGFVIFGGGDRAGNIRRLAEKYELQNFHMLGKIPRSQVEGALALFDVCYAGLQDLDVHKYGISCNKIYEYMYCAKPILGCYIAGYDPIKDSQCGLTVAPGHANEQFEALSTLLRDKELREMMGRNGRQYFEKHHDFSSISKLLLKQLRHLKGLS